MRDASLAVSPSSLAQPASRSSCRARSSASSRYARERAEPRGHRERMPGVRMAGRAARGVERLRRDASRTITPPSGTYAEVTPFAKVIRSGMTPKRSLANAAPVRPKPVITSSKIEQDAVAGRRARAAREVAVGIHDDAVRADDRLDHESRQRASGSSYVRISLEMLERALHFFARIARCGRGCDTETARRSARRPANVQARPASAGFRRSALPRPARNRGTNETRSSTFVRPVTHARDFHRVFVGFRAAGREERAAAFFRPRARSPRAARELGAFVVERWRREAQRGRPARDRLDHARWPWPRFAATSPAERSR